MTLIVVVVLIAFLRSDLLFLQHAVCVYIYEFVIPMLHTHNLSVKGIYGRSIVGGEFLRLTGNNVENGMTLDDNEY